MNKKEKNINIVVFGIIGIVAGALAAVLLHTLPIPYVVAAGIGILIVIVFYNALRIPFSPASPP